MDMHMVMEQLVPGMYDLDNSGSCAKVFRVIGKLYQGFPHALVEKLVECFPVSRKKRVQFMREGADDMLIRGADQLAFSLFQPCCL